MDPLTVFRPAIEYAESGFAVTVKKQELIAGAAEDLLSRPHDPWLASSLSDHISANS